MGSGVDKESNILKHLWHYHARITCHVFRVAHSHAQKKEKTSLLALFPFSPTIIKQVTYLWYKNDNKNQILKESSEKLCNFKA